MKKREDAHKKEDIPPIPESTRAKWQEIGKAHGLLEKEIDFMLGELWKIAKHDKGES